MAEHLITKMFGNFTIHEYFHDVEDDNEDHDV